MCIYIYIYIYVYIFFFRFFSLIDYSKISNIVIVPYAIKYKLELRKIDISMILSIDLPNFRVGYIEDF